MIQALIFDFDGLLVDTETPAFESWRALYAEYGQQLSLELWKDSLGTLEGLRVLECTAADMKHAWKYFARTDFHKLSAFIVLGKSLALLLAQIGNRCCVLSNGATLEGHDTIACFCQRVST